MGRRSSMTIQHRHSLGLRIRPMRNRRQRGRILGARHSRRRGLCSLGFALAIAAAPSIAAADDDESPKAGLPSNPFYALDTKNLFGFLEGADVGEKGDRSLEFETTGSFGEAQGLYRSIEQEFIFENTLTEFAWTRARSACARPGYPARVRPARFRRRQFHRASRPSSGTLCLHRTADVPIQVTLTVAARVQRSSPTPGGRPTISARRSAPSRTSSPAISAFMAQSISSTRPTASRLPGQLRQDTALLSASAALSYRLTPPLMFGAEADYDRAYGGLVPRGFEGQAFYLGPTFHYQINEKIDLSAAFPRTNARRPGRL